MQTEIKPGRSTSTEHRHSGDAGSLQHVSQYEAIGGLNATHLKHIALLQPMKPNMVTEPNERIRSVWAAFLWHEIEHFNMCNELLLKYAKKDIRDVVKDDRAEPPNVFESNKICERFFDVSG